MKDYARKVYRKLRGIRSRRRFRRRLVENMQFDVELYEKHSKTFNRSLKQTEHAILELAHSIEKGLMRKNMRRLYGKEKVESMMKLMNRLWCLKRESYYLKIGESALNSYFIYFESESDEIVKRLRGFVKRTRDIQSIAGFTKVRIQGENLSDDFKKILISRHSIRSFSPKDMPLEVIRDAVSMAMRVPSQCNRQSSRAHVFTDREIVRKALEMQRGASGFSDEVPVLISVTNGLSAWDSANERNQCFVDGGLFGMVLIYALHSHGLATCALNNAFEGEKELEMKAFLGIPEDERMILFIAVGHYPEGDVKIAKSPRILIQDVLTIHN
jgi:nitroreductase